MNRTDLETRIANLFAENGELIEERDRLRTELTEKDEIISQMQKALEMKCRHCQFAGPEFQTDPKMDICGHCIYGVALVAGKP